VLLNAVRLHQLPSRREGRQSWVTASNVAAYLARERSRAEHVAAWSAGSAIAAGTHANAA